MKRARLPGMLLWAFTVLIHSYSLAAETFTHPTSTAQNTNCEFNDTTCATTNRHTGIDYSRHGAQTVIATHDGIVRRIETMSANDHGMGTNVIVSHKLMDGRTIYSSYSHLNSVDGRIRLNQFVARGQTIGQMGGSGYGRADHWGVHLHFELKTSLTTGSVPANHWGYTPTSPTNFGYINPNDYIGRETAAYPLLDVFDFWQSSTNGTYPASCRSGDNILNAQFKVRNTYETAQYIDQLALAVHRSDGTYMFDVSSWSSAQTLQPQAFLHLFPDDASITSPGTYHLIAKAFVNGAWRELRRLPFSVVTNPACTTPSVSEMATATFDWVERVYGQWFVPHQNTGTNSTTNPTTYYRSYPNGSALYVWTDGNVWYNIHGTGWYSTNSSIDEWYGATR